VWLDFVLMLTIFPHPKAKTFCLARLLAKKKRTLARWQESFFSQERSPDTNSFILRMTKNHQHSTKKASHTQEKSQGTSISVEDANI
jgi:hypothetical protein